MKFTQVTWYSKLLALTLFVALPFIGFCAGVWYQKQISPNQDGSVVVIDTDKKDESKTVVDSNKVSLKTSFKNGVLTYSGTVQVPTACYNIRGETVVLESYPEQVQIRLTTEELKPGPTMGVCAQVATTKEVSGELKVSENASVSVYLNDELVRQ